MIKQKEQDQQISLQTSRFYQNKRSNNANDKAQTNNFQQIQFKVNADRSIKQKLDEVQSDQGTQQSDLGIKFEQQLIPLQPKSSSYKSAQSKMTSELSSMNSARDNYGSDYLFNAINSFQVETVEKLLKFEGFNVQIRDSERNTPLHICMQNFTKDIYLQGKIAKILLEHGAKPNSRNKEGWCPIHLAAKKGSLSAIKFAVSHNLSILQNNSENQKVKKSENIGSRDNTPSAKIKKYESMNNSINKSGFESKDKQNRKQLFNLKKKGGPEKWSLLHIAANLGHVSMLDFLFQINYDMTTQNILGQQAKQVAIHSLILHKLLKKYENLWLNVAIFSDDEMAQGICGLNYGGVIDQISSMPCSAFQEYQQQQLWSRNREVINEKRNVQDLKHLIEQTMQKKQNFLNNSDFSSFIDTENQNQSQSNPNNNFQRKFNSFLGNNNQNNQSNNPSFLNSQKNSFIDNFYSQNYYTSSQQLNINSRNNSFISNKKNNVPSFINASNSFISSNSDQNIRNDDDQNIFQKENQTNNTINKNTNTNFNNIINNKQNNKQNNNVFNQINNLNTQNVNQNNRQNNQLNVSNNLMNRSNNNFYSSNNIINTSNNQINSSNNLINTSDNGIHKKLLNNNQFQIRNDNEDDFALGVKPEDTEEDLDGDDKDDYEKSSQQSKIKLNQNSNTQLQKDQQHPLQLLQAVYKDTELTENEFEECTFEEQKAKQNKFIEQFSSVQSSSNQMVNHQRQRADWNIFNQRRQKEMQITQMLSLDKFMNEINHIQTLIVSLTSPNYLQQLNNQQCSSNNPNSNIPFQFQNQIQQINVSTQSFARSPSYNQLFCSNQSTQTKQKRSNSKIFESQWLTPLPSNRQHNQSSAVNQFDVSEVSSLDSCEKQNNILSNYSRLQEILKLINYLHLIHLKLVKMDSIHFKSEVLPMNIYILSEFLCFDKNSQNSLEIQKKQASIIPTLLLEIFDHFILFIRSSIYFQGEENFNQTMFSPRGFQNFSEIANKQIDLTPSRLNYHQQNNQFNSNNVKVDSYITPNSSPFQRTAHSPHESRSPFMNKQKLNITPQNSNKSHTIANTTSNNTNFSNLNTSATPQNTNKTHINNNTPYNSKQSQNINLTPTHINITPNNMNKGFSNSNTTPFQINKTIFNTNQINQNTDATPSNSAKSPFQSNTSIQKNPNQSSNKYQKSYYSNSPSMYSLSSNSFLDSICSDNEDSVDNKPITLIEALDCLNRMLRLFEMFGCKDLIQRILPSIKIKVKSPIQFFETEEPLIVKDHQRSFSPFNFTSGINQQDNTPDYKKKRERSRGGGFNSFSPFGRSNAYTLKEKYVKCHKEQHYTEKILFDFEAFQTQQYLETNFAFNQLQPTHLDQYLKSISKQTGIQQNHQNRSKVGDKQKDLRQYKSTMNSPNQKSNDNVSPLSNINDISQNYFPATKIKNLSQYQSNIEQQSNIQQNQKNISNNKKIDQNQRILFDKNKEQLDDQIQFIDNLKNKQKNDSSNNSLFSQESTGINKHSSSSINNQQIQSNTINKQSQSTGIYQQEQNEANKQSKSTGFNKQIKQVETNQQFNQAGSQKYVKEMQRQPQNNVQMNQQLIKQRNNPSQIQQQQQLQPLSFQRKNSSNNQNELIDISIDLIDQKEKKINDLQRISDMQIHNIAQLNNTQKDKKNFETFFSILQDQQKEPQNQNPRSNILNQQFNNGNSNQQINQSNIQSKSNLQRNTSDNSLLNNQQYSSQPGQNINFNNRQKNGFTNLIQNQIQANQNERNGIQYNQQGQMGNKQISNGNEQTNKQFINQQPINIPQYQSLNIIDTNKMANQWLNGKQKTYNIINNNDFSKQNKIPQNNQRNVATLQVDIRKLEYTQTTGPQMMIGTNKQLQGDMSYDELNESKLNMINFEQQQQNHRQLKNDKQNNQFINTINNNNNKILAKKEQNPNIQVNNIKKGRYSSVTGEENVTDDEDFNDETNKNKFQESDSNKYRTANQLISPFTFKQNLQQYQIL